jgi:ABC-type bacteriocin/lantibiotic exporter with double-glycine peptidase domain
MLKILSLLNVFQKKKLFSIILLIIILGIIEICIFSLLQPILNYFNNISFSGNNLLLGKLFFNKNTTLQWCLVIFIIFYILRCFLTIYISYKKSSLEKNINDNLSNKLYEIYLTKDFQFFINKNSSNLIANIITEVEKFSYNIIGASIFLLTEIFVVICITIFLLINYFYGTSFILIFISISFYIIFIFYKKKFLAMGHQRLVMNAKRYEDLQRSFYIIQNIKLDHLEKYFSDKFKKNTQLSSNTHLFSQVASEVPKPIVELLVLGLLILIVYFFYYYFNFGKKEILSMLALYTIAIFRILPSSNRILNCINMIKFYNSCTNLLISEFKLLNENSASSFIKNQSKELTFAKEITLERINFNYEFSKKSILVDINLNIKKNEIIGISGESGSGKSTLLNIICFLLKPSSGKIFIDNIPIENIYKSYQLKIGYVPQISYLIDDTFIQNIIFGVDKIDYDYNLFKEVIIKSDLEKVLENLPLKENTIIGERGSKFSGGQQQRMSIARALYKRPEILILDEATSSLDERSEKEILHTINNLKNKLTIIIVAHKKSVLNFCDKIYEIKEGKINQIK